MSYPSLRNPRPVLHMADGGFVSYDAGSLRGMVPKGYSQPAPSLPTSLREPIRFAHGGLVHGPGTGTSDSIPARLSHGEAVLPADTVRALGHDQVQHLIDSTHTPVNKPEPSLRGPVHLANGTSGLDPYTDHRFPGAGPQTAEPPVCTAKTPTGLPAPTPGTAVGPATYKPNFTMGGNPPPAAPSPYDIPKNVANPNVTPDRLGSLREAIKSPANTGPQMPAGGVAPAANAVGDAAPSRFASLRNGANNFFGAGESAGSVGSAFKSVGSPILNAGKSAFNTMGRFVAPAVAAQTAAQGLSTDTEDYAKRFGLEGTAPGVARDLGVRALGIASDLGNNFTGGLAKKYLYRDGENGDLAPSLRTPVSPAASMPPQSSSLRADQAQPLTQAPAVAPDALRRINGGSSSLFTNQPDGGLTGNDALMGRKPMSAQNQSAFDAMGDRANAEGAAVAQASVAADNDRANSSSLRDPIQMALNRLSQGRLTKAGLEALQGVATNATSLRGHQMQNSVAMRGQDITREGHLLTNDNAMRRMQFDNGWKNKEFNQKQNEQDFTQGQAADKNGQTNLENMFRTNVDGKDVPDTAKIADYQRNVQSTIPDMVTALQKVGTPAALAKANDLQARGMAALDKSDHERLSSMQAVKDRLQQTHGNLVGSTHVQSSSLMGYQQKPGTNAKDGSVYFVNGSKTPTKHLNYTEPGNLILPDMLKQRSDRLTRGINLQTN